jgi:hypothetical protein
MKLNRPIAIICSIGNVELEIQQCLLGIFSNVEVGDVNLATSKVEVGDVNLATSKVELATWQSGKGQLSFWQSGLGKIGNQLDKDLRKIT